ncbi:MAG TPA: zf-TFIIB domain-containing protein [Gemmatimonadaceae bacterium]
MPASTLRCPGCGAPAAADAQHCNYCGSALATVTCASCFAPMFKGSRFCSQCGAEATRQVLDDAPLKCPRCRAEMQALLLGTLRARECAECGGLWIAPDTLQNLCNAREAHSGVIGALAARIPNNTTPPDIVQYLPCPQCTGLMNRTNFGKSSGVVIDVCKRDGVWFDRGELQRVIGFVDAGGLTAQRERDREQLADEQRRLATMQAYGGGPISVTRSYNSVVIHGGKSDSMSTDGVEGILLQIAGLFHG